MMKRKITILFVAVLFGSKSFTLGQTKFSPVQIKEDLYFLYETLDKSHFDLYGNTPKATFDAEFKKIEAAINDSLSLIQIDRLFHPFVALTNEGHCSLELPIGAYVDYLKKGGSLFPLDVYFKDNRVFVLDNFSANSAVKTGDEIISINGRPIDSVLKDFSKYVSGENSYAKNISIESISFSRLYWIINGEDKSFTIGIKRNCVDRENAEIEAISAGEFEIRKAKQKSESNQQRVFNYINDIAYLCPGPFLNLSKQANNQINSEMLDNKTFVSFLDSCFTNIHDKNTENLIIDLRGNPGGAAIFSNPLVAYFATEPFIGASEFKIRTSKLSKEFWENVSDTSALTKEIKQQVLSRKNGERFTIDGTKYKYHPRMDSLKFRGKVYVLINGLTFSQAIEVAGMIKKYGFAKLIGEPTTPLLSANARQFKLPNTQLTVTFPEAYYINDSMKNGVRPDYYVKDNVLTDEDEVVDFVMRMIKK